MVLGVFREVVEGGVEFPVLGNGLVGYVEVGCVKVRVVVHRVYSFHLVMENLDLSLTISDRKAISQERDGWARGYLNLLTICHRGFGLGRKSASALLQT